MSHDPSEGRTARSSHPKTDTGDDSSSPSGPDLSGAPDGLVDVLESAAKLQKAVPDAVLVGGSVSAAYAGHRLSFDHDHVIASLKDRYEAILEAVEATEGWATSVRASKPPMTLMGRLGGIEAGLRQLRRTVPLQTQRLILPNGDHVTIPTLEEALRVKAYLVVQRNQVRDYLDVAALSDHMGISDAAECLRTIDEFYEDRSGDRESVISALVSRLAQPQPRDTAALSDLPHYKKLKPRWQDWTETTRVCGDLAQAILD